MPRTLPPPPDCPIGWIGTGVMGSAMAGHLLDAGHPLRVHTRTRSKAESLIERGATWAPDPAAAAVEARVIGVMVGTPSDVRTVIGSVLPTLNAGTVVIDFTTSTPSLAIELAEWGRTTGVTVLDAPVSGGDIGARDATLSIMVGGDADGFALARGVLDRLGRTVVHHGPPGSGQHAKAVNQTLIAGTMLGLCEALVYARHAGLDPEAILTSVGGGAAASWALERLAPRILAGDTEPGFAIRHFAKDLRIVLDESRRMGLTLHGVELAERLYADLVTRGDGDLGTQALGRVIDEVIGE